MVTNFVNCFLILNLLNGFVNGNFEQERVLSQQPEQVHLSLGSNPSEMIVTWTTFDSIGKPVVEYGTKKLDLLSTGSSSKFVDGGSERRSMLIHRVLLTNLVPGQTYMYHVGSEFGWSPIFWFAAVKNGSDWSPRLAVFGDLGNENAKTLPRLQEDAQSGAFDAILHVGDFAYNLDTDNARVGDQFMRQIEPIAAYVPYMTAVGNHEQAYNFSNYVNRFSMMDSKSGQINNLFYSYDIGPAHFITFSTEFYFFTNYGQSQLFTQYEWLEKDLIEATKPENRAQRPWIITLGHRAMYCNLHFENYTECLNRDTNFRKGDSNFPGLEDLFYKYGVDLEIWAHEHLYERLWPIYDQKVYNGSTSEPYTNPGAPVHVTTGSAGCYEGIEYNVLEQADWSALRIYDYGFSIITINNSTHLTFEQLSAEKNHKVVDRFTIIKDNHGPYPTRNTTKSSN
ncbi:acid phosphatase type 7-like [Panonychus citri]|uniref:acid phosphatase type 7-like n=1 Tax=Panonychus citri TaxID=50023 RepID=UPI00230791BD|nr:acid phosphatase type 7-like [Panonychus citri]XP_053210302.1 acid phosphatase type 7-like [Panonychus citri]